MSDRNYGDEYAEQQERYQEQALLTDEEIDELEDRGVDLDDPVAVRNELKIIEDEQWDKLD